MRDFNLCGHIFCDLQCSFSSHSAKYATTSENFELRYLRWDYLVRAKNPPQKWLDSIEKVVQYLCHNSYPKYAKMLESQSMDKDDLLSMIRVFAVSFYGTSSYETQKDKEKEKIESFYEKNGRSPTEEELSVADNYRLMYFVKQRLVDAQKVFNIRLKNEPRDTGRALYKISASKYTDFAKSITIKPELAGWEKVSVKEYKTLSTILGNHDLVEFGDIVYKFFNFSQYVSHIEDLNDVIHIVDERQTPYDYTVEMEGERLAKPYLSETANLTIKKLIDTPIEKRGSVIGKLKRNAHKLGIDKNQFSEIMKVYREYTKNEAR